MALMQFNLPSGRKIYLRDLKQRQTYLGVIEGTPSPRLNAMEINDVMRRHGGAGSGVQLIRPPGPYPLEPNADYPFGGPARLPRISCVAKFESMSPVHDQEEDYSALVLVWFSDELCTKESILALAPLIDWDGYAWDCLL